MKPSLVFLILLPLVKTSLTAAVRARRENVLSFLNDALSPSAVPQTTGFRKPPNKPVTENNSEDISDAKSSESFSATGFKDAVKDLESHEMVVKNDKVPSRRKTGMDRDTVGAVDLSRGQVQDHDSRELTGLDSEELMTADTQKDGDRVVLSPPNAQRREENVNGLNDDVTPDLSKDAPDWDSVEENRGRLAAAGNSRDTDYDDTKEYTSLETYPKGHFSVPAKSRSFK